ncbi:MAG: SemiSWEET transporter [Leptospiraceae bacterium]|nr:SemiSWEET transporter [Leptospiraceae bacterium]
MTTEIIGYIAAFLTTISFVPQTIRVVMTKRTEDISRNMYIILILGIILWLVYGIIKKEFPIIFANIFTFIFASTILFYKLKEGN